MAPQPDVEKPADDPFSLLGENWPPESELAYHAAEVVADSSSVAAQEQAQSASDGESKMSDEKGKTAQSVSDGYGSAASALSEQSRNLTTISAWMLDAAGEVRKGKRRITALVSTGNREIRDAITSETSGTPVSPSSTELITQYRNDIQGVAAKLVTDLDAIGHSLQGHPGSSSATPAYASVPTTPTTERADPRAVVTAYNTGQHPAVEPQRLPEMPRATSPSGTESTSVPGTPSTPSAPTRSANPTLANLISGNAASSGNATAPSGTGSSHGSASGTAPDGKAAQPTEQHQQIRPTSRPSSVSIPLPDAPAVAADIATAVTSATASQLPASTAPTTPGSSLSTSTGITPGVSGTPPVTPAPPGGLSPIGGLTPSPVVQTPPASQASPTSPTPGVQAPAQQTPAPAPRGPVADLAWIQKSYGLSPGLDFPKPESFVVTALFITDMAEPEATLHRALATLRHQFEQAGWSQPLAVGLIKRGFETRLVYVTADALSIHPHGVLLPAGVTPLDEMPGMPATPELAGSLMVTDKLISLIPRNWEVEGVLSTVYGGENSQSVEEFHSLVESGELLPCTVSRGRDDLEADEALRVFARAAIGSRGVGGLDVESARIRAGRWVGTQPAGYLDSLARWYLSDAAESMSLGRWGEAVWSCEKYMPIKDAEKQAA